MLGTIHDMLKRGGLKVTDARVKVLQVFMAGQHLHLSAEDIQISVQNQGDEIPLATVYRVLSQLESANLLVRHRFNNDEVSVYELNSQDHHDHMVCSSCGVVKEFCNDRVERGIREAAKNLGFCEKSHSLTIHGLCQACSSP